MKIGCVKETKKYEFRVGLTPDNVKEYIINGHEVLIEQSAGEGSSFTDKEYQEAGAVIAGSAAEVWQNCDMIIKVKEPLADEYKYMREGQIIYTYLHLAADKPLTEALLKSKSKAIAYETIRDKDGGLPLLRPMSEVAGRLSIQEGAKYLEKPMGGMGLLLSGVPGVKKANIVILGGGVVGTSACKMAIGLGANVTIFDNNPARLSYLDDLFGQCVQTMYSTETAIRKSLMDADLVIGAVLIPGAAAPKLVKKEYLAIMKPGSVIVDVAVDQGGCCESTQATYHDNPVFTLEGVVHYCVANMPGAVSLTSTLALTNATLRHGLNIANKGLEAALKDDPLLIDGVNCYDGKLTCKEVAVALDMEYTGLETLLP